MKKILTLIVLSIILMGTSPVATAQVRKRTTTTQVRKKTTSTTKRKTAAKTTTTAQPTPLPEAKPAVKPTPQPVDLGLSVKWSDIDINAESTTSGGTPYAGNTDVETLLGEGWRLPTPDEFKELKDNCTATISVTNNKPTAIVLTSKKNGAKLTLPFPKIYVTAYGKEIANPVPTRNGDSYGATYWDLDGTWNGFTCLNTRQAVSSSRWEQFQSIVNQLGLSKTKYSEWPDEALAKMPQDGFFFSDYLDFMAKFEVAHSPEIGGASLLIRPVYESDDEDEEEIDSLTFSLNTPGVAVDLGLSVKWANRNIGAAKPEQYGCYYAWGEKEERKVYNSSKIKTKLFYKPVDAAKALWGGQWRMPTAEEFDELSKKCTWVFTVKHKVKGYKVIGPNGNSIFLPTAGIKSESESMHQGRDGSYWTGEKSKRDPQNTAYVFYFRKGNRGIDDTGFECGKTIRPVMAE